MPSLRVKSTRTGLSRRTVVARQPRNVRPRALFPTFAATEPTTLSCPRGTGCGTCDLTRHVGRLVPEVQQHARRGPPPGVHLRWRRGAERHRRPRRRLSCSLGVPGGELPDASDVGAVRGAKLVLGIGPSTTWRIPTTTRLGYPSNGRGRRPRRPRRRPVPCNCRSFSVHTAAVLLRACCCAAVRDAVMAAALIGVRDDSGPRCARSRSSRRATACATTRGGHRALIRSRRRRSTPSSSSVNLRGLSARRRAGRLEARRRRATRVRRFTPRAAGRAARRRSDDGASFAGAAPRAPRSLAVATHRVRFARLRWSLGPPEFLPRSNRRSDAALADVLAARRTRRPRLGRASDSVVLMDYRTGFARGAMARCRALRPMLAYAPASSKGRQLRRRRLRRCAEMIAAVEADRDGGAASPADGRGRSPRGIARKGERLRRSR